jgi:hypothetical protein
MNSPCPELTVRASAFLQCVLTYASSGSRSMRFKQGFSVLKGSLKEVEKQGQILK